MGDPVASGLVARLDRPSGNITGFGYLEATLGGKWLELLSEIAPGLKRAAIMFNPDTTFASAYLASFETAARSLKVAPIIAPVHSDAEIEAHSRACIARRSYRWRPETTYRRSIRHLTGSETAVCSPTEPTW